METWQADDLHHQVVAMAEAIQQLGIREVTFYWYRKEYGGMCGDQLSQIKWLERWNQWLWRAVADPTLED